MKTISILIGAPGIITKGLVKGMEDLEMRGQVKTNQITALFRSVRILKKNNSTI